MNLKCKNCGKAGIPPLEKLFMRKGHNARCTECASEFNYPGWYGILVTFIAAGLGTLFFFLFFLMSIGYAVILSLLAAIVFSGVAMLLAPIKSIESHNRDKGGQSH